MVTTAPRPVAPLVRELERGTEPRPAGPVAREKKRLELAPYLFVLPSLLLIVIWSYYPLLDTVRISFFDGTLLSGPKEFVGFKNYGAVVGTPEFQKSLANTLK